MAPVEELALLDLDRSNKGASKQRRDQINAEIGTMRDLLPLPESSRQRLSQLQIMSLTCVYIRKCNVLQKLFRSKTPETLLPESLDFFQALTGFILVTTREGKLLYISENVTDFLGHSMVDMKTQGDSLYDIVDKRDHGTVQAQLLQGGPANSSNNHKDDFPDLSFFCRMNMSRTLKRQSGFGDVKVMHVRGHFVQVNTSESGCTGDSQYVFMATCSPLITPDLKENLVQNNTMVFKTVHQLDMTFLEVTKTAEYHLGCSADDLQKKSWYSILHPEDIHEAKEKHFQLIRSNHEMGCMLTVRMLRSDGSSFWVNMVMHVRQATISQNDEPLIVCINQVIDAREAYQIKVQGHLFSMYPSRAHELWGSHLPSVTTNSQEPSPRPWIQQSSTNAVPVPGYQSNVPGYMAQGGRQPVFHNLCNSVIPTHRVNKPAAGHPQYNPTSLIQSDHLKAMLKRKIQGPQSSCKPGKMAKISWDLDAANGGTAYSDSDHGMSVLDHYSHAPIAVQADCQGQSVQMLQPSNYRVGVLTAKRSHQVMTCQGLVSPVLNKMSSMISEQIVPDVNVPESYLTPDPSPVSSPQPSHTTVKSEVLEPEEVATQGKTSIIHALQRLVAQNAEVEKTPTERPPERRMQVQATANPMKQNELHILDAFEIEHFFDALEPTETQPKASIKMEEVQIKPEIKMELEEEPIKASNIPNFAALKDERSSPADCLQYHSPAISQPSPPAPVYPQQPLTYIPTVSETSTVPLTHPPIPTTCNQTQLLDTPYAQKDSPRPRTTVSPSGSTSSEESIDDLLSLFSDDGMDLSPLQMDSRDSLLDSSAGDDLLDEEMEKSYSKPYYMEPHCSIALQMNSQRLPEELSPQSNASSLAGEDDHVDDSSALTLDMALSVLNAQEEAEEGCHRSLKDRDVLGTPEDLKLDFFLNSFVPSQGSLNMMKHGQ